MIQQKNLGQKNLFIEEWFISSELAGGVWVKVKDVHGFLKGIALHPLCRLVRRAGPCFELEDELPVTLLWDSLTRVSTEMEIFKDVLLMCPLTVHLLRVYKCFVNY